MKISDRSRHDVVVVGGRVAGSATAMLLALSAPLQLGIALAIAVGVAAGLAVRPDEPAHSPHPPQRTAEVRR